MWPVTFEGYGPVGGGAVIGRDPNTGQGFFSLRFGWGVGGGFKWDPNGGRPGSSPHDYCGTGGVGLGVFADADLNAGPLQASLQNNLGRNYPLIGASNPYGQFMSPSYSFGDSWGIKAGGAFGGEVTFWTRVPGP